MAGRGHCSSRGVLQPRRVAHCEAFRKRAAHAPVEYEPADRRTHRPGLKVFAVAGAARGSPVVRVRAASAFERPPPLDGLELRAGDVYPQRVRAPYVCPERRMLGLVDGHDEASHGALPLRHTAGAVPAGAAVTASVKPAVHGGGVRLSGSRPGAAATTLVFMPRYPVSPLALGAAVRLEARPAVLVCRNTTPRTATNPRLRRSSNGAAGHRSLVSPAPGQTTRPEPVRA